jgi:Protein of unknown function (DUF1348)
MRSGAKNGTFIRGNVPPPTISASNRCQGESKFQIPALYTRSFFDVQPGKTVMTTRPPVPPFTKDTATQKVRLAEDGWNSRDPEKVAQDYSLDSHWRNRAEFVNRRAEIVAFLTRKWAKELDYRLIKELWAFHENRIAVRFA